MSRFALELFAEPHHDAWSKLNLPATAPPQKAVMGGYPGTPKPKDRRLVEHLALLIAAMGWNLSPAPVVFERSKGWKVLVII